MRFKNDMQNYWQAYKDSKDKFFNELQLTAEPTSSGLVRIEPYWECARCRQRFESLEELQTHYTHNQIGADPTLVPQSKRGYTEESWQRGQKVINAPTIKSVM